MDDKKWERFAALGGVLFVILNVVGGAATGEPPAPDDSAQKIASWFQDHHGAIAFSQVTAGIGAIGLVWWAGTLWRRMANAEGRPRLAVASIAAFAASGALYLMANGVLAAMAIRVDDMSPDTLLAFYVLSSVTLAASGFFVAAHLAVTNALAFRTRLLPQWLCGVGALGSVGFLAAAIIGSASDSGLVVGLGLPAFLLWGVWILGVSVTMWRTTPDPAPAA